MSWGQDENIYPILFVLNTRGSHTFHTPLMRVSRCRLNVKCNFCPASSLIELHRLNSCPHCSCCPVFGFGFHMIRENPGPSTECSRTPTQSSEDIDSWITTSYLITDLNHVWGLLCWPYPLLKTNITQISGTISLSSTAHHRYDHWCVECLPRSHQYAVVLKRGGLRSWWRSTRASCLFNLTCPHCHCAFTSTVSTTPASRHAQHSAKKSTSWGKYLQQKTNTITQSTKGEKKDFHVWSTKHLWSFTVEMHRSGFLGPITESSICRSRYCWSPITVSNP